jgi:hypothetical protein
MEHAALRRARRTLEWVTCAPQFVRQEIEGILRFTDLPNRDKERLAHLLAQSEPGDVGTWVCRFPVLAGRDAPARLEGGLLSIVATDPGVLPPRGAVSVAGVLDSGPFSAEADLYLVGLPAQSELLVLGASGGAAAWLASRARATGRPIPRDLVVSAALVPGPGGEPRLAAVAGGAEKAAVVRRESPGAKLLLCGDACGEHVVPLRAGARVQELERQVWGSAAIIDRTQLIHIGALARRSFESHDYAAAALRYREVADPAGPDDVELRHEACLRLAAIAVHAGVPSEADEWMRRADELEGALPRSKRGAYVVERLSTLAGRAIDGFRPIEARALLETDPGRRARTDDTDTWKQLQVRGAWRRLHLLNGAPIEARIEQHAVLRITNDDPVEYPRALIDLAFTETRCGDMSAAWDAFLAARDAIAGMPEIYAVQSRAFLTWHLARFARRGGEMHDLAALLRPPALHALLNDPRLQAAARWRIEALRAETAESVSALAAQLTSFQRWHLGTFLLEVPAMSGVARELLASADVDLSGMPALAQGREALRAGRLDSGLFLAHAVY